MEESFNISFNFLLFKFSLKEVSKKERERKDMNECIILNIFYLQT